MESSGLMSLRPGGNVQVLLWWGTAGQSLLQQTLVLSHPFVSHAVPWCKASGMRLGSTLGVFHGFWHPSAASHGNGPWMLPGGLGFPSWAGLCRGGWVFYPHNTPQTSCPALIWGLCKPALCGLWCPHPNPARDDSQHSCWLWLSRGCVLLPQPKRTGQLCLLYLIQVAALTAQSSSLASSGRGGLLWL